ncbi:MAG TPA: hypothetical protein VF627_01265, partial [Abditibacterium sp.]
MTKPSVCHPPLPVRDFTLELFCRVDDELRDQAKPALAQLHPSEVVTLGLLQALRGQGHRAFYRWVCKELGALFPRLPEQSRLFRLLGKYRHLARRFLAGATPLGVCDWACATPLGIELMHPRREGRCWWHYGRKGKCNGRWIVGAQFFVLLNSWGQIVRWSRCPANLHDQVFQCLIEDFVGQDPEDKAACQMVVLADSGFHAKEGDPKNLKICQRGTWNERMLIETAFSLFETAFSLFETAFSLFETAFSL